MSNIPAKLVAEFATISNRIEEAIRQDERHKVLTQLAKERKEQLETAESKLLRAVMGSVPDPVKRSTKLGKLYLCLASRHYAVNRDTLVRHSGMTLGSVHKGIQELRDRGYSIQCIRQGNKPKYKLVA
tara:strand:- start:102 stop:485 length:384 start_codon:yes stop_codon:yes gene_type:complete